MVIFSETFLGPPKAFFRVWGTPYNISEKVKCSSSVRQTQFLLNPFIFTADGDEAAAHGIFGYRAGVHKL